MPEFSGARDSHLTVMPKSSIVAAQRLQALIAKLRAAGELSTLVWRGHLRVSLIASELGVPRSSLSSNPDLAPMIRALKTELIKNEKPSCTDTQKRQASKLVRAIRKTGVSSRADLAHHDSRLYKSVLTSPCREKIFLAAGLPSRRAGLDGCSDEEILALCKPFENLTDLKYKKNVLHQQIKGRGLEDAVVSRYGWFSFGFISRDGRQYRSREELILGNILTYNGVAFGYDGMLAGPVPKGRKSYRYDFWLTEHDLYIEVLQNGLAWDQPGAQDRKAVYARRLKKKLKYYRSISIRPLLLNTERFSTHDRELKFAQYCISGLHRQGVHLRMPAPAALLHRRPSGISDLPRSKLLNGPLRDCVGIADFDNHFSTVKNMLKTRPDYEQVRAAIAKRGQAAKAKNLSLSFAARRKRYRPYAEAQRFVASLGLSGQKEWQQYAHHGIAGLPVLPPDIPKDPYVVYRRSGGWAGYWAWLHKTKK